MNVTPSSPICTQKKKEKEWQDKHLYALQIANKQGKGILGSISASTRHIYLAARKMTCMD